MLHLGLLSGSPAPPAAPKDGAGWRAGNVSSLLHLGVMPQKREHRGRRGWNRTGRPRPHTKRSVWELHPLKKPQRASPQWVRYRKTCLRPNRAWQPGPGCLFRSPLVQKKKKNSASILGSNHLLTLFLLGGELIAGHLRYWKQSPPNGFIIRTWLERVSRPCLMRGANCKSCFGLT